MTKDQKALTPKQEAFCLAYIETSNASEAYRRSYNAGNMKPSVIAVKACELLATGNVSGRVKGLQEAHVEHHKITVADLLIELEEARIAARGGERPQAAAMVAATMGKAKILGMEGVQKIDLSSKDGSMSPAAIELTDAQLERIAAMGAGRPSAE